LSTRVIYDISIWEEIRPIVSWKIPQLVENINKEISKDRSLAEFQGKHPVPWQLAEIMEQRANAWVRRIYDLCCDAYKNSGKAVSEGFDRALWAYCIEPFIRGQNQADIHKETMSGFLELLLCAVGSPREKRSSLTVSQKDCCLAVRGKVHSAWLSKLTHVPPTVDEAAAALLRHKAVEARAVRLAAGLPPDPPPPTPPAPAPPLARPTASPPQPTTPVTSRATVSVQKEAAPEQLEGSKGDAHTVSDAVGGTTWEEIEILFLSDERVQIRNGGNRETRNYAEFGFQDGRTGNPNQAWEALRALAEKNGVIQDVTAVNQPWPKVEKRIQEIRKVLREHFHISTDPIPFVEGVGYQACFKVGCSPSFHT
jgi:hypothetical protein